MTQKRKIHISRHDFYTVPNILSYLRILLVPVFMICYLSGFYASDPVSGSVLKWVGLSMVILASFTDMVDGKIARRYNMITELGKFLDPLADKMMQLAITIVAAIVFTHMTGKMYMWFLIGFFVFKEASQFLLIYLTYRHGQYLNGAKWYGKVATFGFDVLMITLLMLPIFISEDALNANGALLILMVTVSGALLFFAWIMYIIECIRLLRSGIHNIPSSLYNGGKDEAELVSESAKPKKGEKDD